MLCDKHLSKMQLETAQLLCTAIHCKDLDLAYLSTDHRLYKKTHVNHPSTVWARSSIDNVRWLLSYVRGMDREWQSRGHRLHASCKVSIDAACYLTAHAKLPEGLTEVPLCMPDELKPCSHLPMSEAVQFYRNYYVTCKLDIATWPAGRTPDWFTKPEEFSNEIARESTQRRA
jgi:hypothetical protein